MSDKSSGHVVIEMAELKPSDKKDNQKRPEVPWTSSTAQTRKQRDEEFDIDMLHRAIADTGRWAYGTISVEAWVLDEETGKLVRPRRAFWFDPVAVQEGAGNEAMMRLVDYTREDFVRPDPLAPGVGLAGALWSELHQDNRGSFMPTMKNINVGLNAKHVAWREVEPISNDPDQPYNLRLKLAVEAGIGLAAGVRFQFQGTEGLVLYMARGTTDVTKLKSQTNEQYLLSAAEVIGSIVSLRGPRHVCLEERRAERESTRRRVRQKMVAFVRMGGSFLNVSGRNYDESKISDNATERMESSISGSTRKEASPSGKTLKSRIIMMFRKWKGANNEPPPPFTTKESIWTFCGCFLTLLALLNFSDAITKRNPDLGLVLGPFGALMTLQFSLTQAPASQPRNAILGQAISISIAMAFSLTGRLEKNTRRSLGTSLAIMCMARLGVTHPPAGAAALIFTGGGYTWDHMGLMLAGNVLAIFFAAVINDLNVKRQYPTFWGFGYWHKHFFGLKEKNKAA
mmetsp:Transcript_37540/g.79160  ORF Transcript_37540/g.79160 Transcript_37540/m.79160 type:complete len:512 (-) Transcript_37540:1674-3209(-)